jgi:hypothetical protein
MSKKIPCPEINACWHTGDLLPEQSNTIPLQNHCMDFKSSEYHNTFKGKVSKHTSCAQNSSYCILQCYPSVQSKATLTLISTGIDFRTHVDWDFSAHLCEYYTLQSIFLTTCIWHLSSGIWCCEVPWKPRDASGSKKKKPKWRRSLWEPHILHFDLHSIREFLRTIRIHTEKCRTQSQT